MATTELRGFCRQTKLGAAIEVKNWETPVDGIGVCLEAGKSCIRCRENQRVIIDGTTVRLQYGRTIVDISPIHTTPQA